jgi:TIR domain
MVYHTVFAQVDLRETKELVEIDHHGPSRVELHSIQLPQDGSAFHFLRGAGVPEEWIDDYRAHMMHPIQYYSCFISYTHEDDTLAKRLHADLQDKGVRCWFAPEDMKIGDKIRPRIDEMIHQQEKLLLLLSEHSLASDWVEDEVETAIEKEQRQHREVLFPVRLDNKVMETNRAWAAKLRRQRHIGDFTNWTNPQAYQQAFERLLHDLHKADE